MVRKVTTKALSWRYKSSFSFLNYLFVNSSFIYYISHLFNKEVPKNTHFMRPRGRSNFAPSCVTCRLVCCTLQLQWKMIAHGLNILDWHAGTGDEIRVQL